MLGLTDRSKSGKQPMDTYDVVIIGGGIAGLSAAVYGGWLGRKVFLAERQMFGG